MRIASSESCDQQQMCVVQVDILEGLQHSKLSYSSEPDSPLHGLPTITGLLSPENDRAAVAPHSAWGILLTTSLPFLLSESQAAARFLGFIKAEAPTEQVASFPSTYTTQCLPCLLLGGLCVLLHANTDEQPLHLCQVQAFCKSFIKSLCRTSCASAVPCHSMAAQWHEPLLTLCGLTPAGSTKDQQYARSSSQLSSSSKGLSSFSKGTSRGPVRGSGQGNFQHREIDDEESQALEPEGFGVLSALMEGIQSDFQSLVKLAAQFPMSCSSWCHNSNSLLSLPITICRCCAVLCMLSEKCIRAIF